MITRVREGTDSHLSFLSASAGTLVGFSRSFDSADKTGEFPLFILAVAKELAKENKYNGGRGLRLGHEPFKEHLERYVLTTDGKFMKLHFPENRGGIYIPKITAEKVLPNRACYPVHMAYSGREEICRGLREIGGPMEIYAELIEKEVIQTERTPLGERVKNTIFGGLFPPLRYKPQKR